MARAGAKSSAVFRHTHELDSSSIGVGRKGRDDSFSTLPSITWWSWSLQNTVIKNVGLASYNKVAQGPWSHKSQVINYK